MPTAISGTNGVLQSYDFQTLVTGFSYTFSAGTLTLIMNPAGTLATGTITMPASPADGMVITIESTQQITALTVQGNIGQSLVGGTMTMRANQPESFIYRLTNTTWYPFAGATNSQIVPGTAVTASSTSVDFTSIPSWVKRVTVMFSGVSLSASAQILVQLGTGAGPTFTTSGYISTGSGISGTPVATSSTSGFVVRTDGSGQIVSGIMTIVNITGNSWVSSHSGKQSTTTTLVGGGDVSLGAALTAIRITSTSTDTFDAGTINIFYE